MGTIWDYVGKKLGLPELEQRVRRRSWLEHVVMELYQEQNGGLLHESVKLYSIQPPVSPLSLAVGSHIVTGSQLIPSITP